MKDITKTISENRRSLDSLPSVYKLSASDVWMIADQNGAQLTDETVDAIITAYEYGFIKGQRNIRNQQKRNK